MKNRSVTEDLEAVTKRLRSAEEAHGKEVDEHQRRSNDLQERLVETRAEKAEVSAENLYGRSSPSMLNRAGHR